jgi:hypothetical protein
MCFSASHSAMSNARGDAGRGDDVAVVHDAGVADQRRGRALQIVVVLVVRGRRAAVQQTRGREQERSGAYRRDGRTAGMTCRDDGR